MSDKRSEDGPPERDDFIHRLFRHLRSGFSDIVVNLVDRVDKRLEIFIDDERHQSPDADRIAVDAFSDLVDVFSSVATSTPDEASESEESEDAPHDPSDDSDDDA